MSGALKHPLRVGLRLTWLAGEVVWAALIFLPLLRSGRPSLETRARWLQASCRRVLRIFNTDIHATGPIPNRGLLVSNHLSYLDILVLSALTPSIFVAKSEVRRWPIFGWFARLGGTLFTDRARRTQVGALAKELRSSLEQGTLVVLFPEGTSSDGQTVLPFKSALLEPARDCSYCLSASLIEYHLEDGDVGEEVCYWKDMTFVPHLLNLLSKRRIQAFVRFSELRDRTDDRKALARRLHSEVSKLKFSLEYAKA
jgi:1-acyl-sn-glycerol-3-phosphate acyltransferase